MLSLTIVRLGLTFAGLAVAGLRAQDRAGYVLLVSGNGIWSSTSRAKLAPGDEVFAGNRIECEGCKDSQKDTLTLAMLDGTAPPYNRGFTVPPLHDSMRSEISRMVTAVANALTQQKHTLVFGISRGSMDVAPAVLKLTEHRVDMAPALGMLDPGEYHLEFTPIDGGSAIAAKCNYDPPTDTSAAAALSPGAYTLRATSSSGKPLGNTTVLVAAASDFDARTEEFHRAVELTAAWPAGAGPQVRGTFLSALLVALAFSPVAGVR